MKMNTSIGGGFINPNESISSPTVTDRRSNQKQQFIPCTGSIISKAVYNSVDQTFTYQNYQILNVVLVAYVVSVHDSPTALVYEVNDGTTSSNIVVKKWFEDKSQDAYRLSFCKENRFIRFVGHLRQQMENEERFLMAFGILPIDDINELTYHLVDVVHSHLLLPKLQTQENAEEVKRESHSKIDNKTGNNLEVTDTGIGAGLDQISKNILSAISSHNFGGSGIHRNEIMKKIPKVDPSVFREKLDFLYSEGHIYTTKDDDHYQIARNYDYGY